MKRVVLWVGVLSLLALVGQGCQGKADDGSATATSGGGTGGSGPMVRTTEPCEIGTTECVSDKVGRACPDATEPGWIYFACGDTELCQMGHCELDPDAAGRLGLCLEGVKECVSDALARQCARGGDAWLPLACASGTVCSAGDCVPSSAPDSGAVLICEPMETECIHQYALRQCNSDGTAWLYVACPVDRVCSAGDCVPTNDGGSGADAGDGG